MAGVIIYSLDWPKFNALVERPTPAQVMFLAEGIANERKYWSGNFDECDPVMNWPVDAESLAPFVAMRLDCAYLCTDLSLQEQMLWETTFSGKCMNSNLDVGLREDIEGVYFDVIALIASQLGDRPGTLGKSAMSRFGTAPFRYYASAVPLDLDRSDWRPMHSMHTPDEVRQMLSELRSVTPVVEAAKDPDVREQFRMELLPAIEQIANEERVLFIQVDT